MTIGHGSFGLTVGDLKRRESRQSKKNNKSSEFSDIKDTLEGLPMKEAFLFREGLLEGSQIVPFMGDFCRPCNPL